MKKIHKHFYHKVKFTVYYTMQIPKFLKKPAALKSKKSNCHIVKKLHKSNVYMGNNSEIQSEN